MFIKEALKFLKVNAIILISGIIVLLYIAYKAATTSFTHDESISYLNYVHSGFIDIITFYDGYTNNHILNSLLMKYSETLFGSSEFSLRLPNLLLFCVFLIYSLLMFRKSKKVIAIVIFLLLCTNNSLIDFFGLARGYGLSFGFMLMSLYHFIRSFYERKTRNIVLFHSGALLAVLSSFILLDFYIALIVIYNVIEFIDCRIISHKNYNLWRSNKIHVIPVLVVIVVMFEPLRNMIQSSSLDFGGKNNFYCDTVSQLTKYFLHDYTAITSFTLIVARIIFTIIALVPMVIIIYKVFRKDGTFFAEYKELVISNLLVVFISVIIILQHLVLKADYPINRFSIFLLPVLIIHLGFFVIYLTDHYKSVVTVPAICLALISCISFAFRADLHSSSEWKFDSETKNMIQKLTEYHSNNDPDTANIKLGISWLFEPSINFYRQTKNLTWYLSTGMG